MSNNASVLTILRDLTVLQWNMLFGLNSTHPSFLTEAAPPLSITMQPALRLHRLVQASVLNSSLSDHCLPLSCMNQEKENKPALPDGREVRGEAQEMVVTR